MTKVVTGDVISPEDKWLDRWESDVEFGRQTMNGASPVMIKRIKQIPEKFPVTDEDVHSLLRRGLTLEQEAAAGNIYIVDFEILEGIETGWSGGEKDEGERLDMAAAMGLFYVQPINPNTNSESLVPIALQLGQAPGAGCPIWTPNDSKYDWLLAKFWFRHADVQVANVVTHLSSTHLFVEPFALAMNRCLAPVHPIFKMLKEHLKFIISIDTLAREVLISPGGSGDISLSIGHGSAGIKQLLAKAFRTMTYEEDLHYMNNLEARDVMDLPGYHHRDDSVRLWGVILEYVTGFIDIFYADTDSWSADEAVINDHELQNWVEEVYDKGFGKFKDDDDYGALKAPSIGLPKELKSKKELIDYLQILVFTDTVRHNFANFYIFQ